MFNTKVKKEKTEEANNAPSLGEQLALRLSFSDKLNQREMTGFKKKPLTSGIKTPPASDIVEEVERGLEDDEGKPVSKTKCATPHHKESKQK